MIKKIAWNTFKNTGDINTFLELKQIENIEQRKEKEENKIENNLENNLENIIKEEEGKWQQQKYQE